MKFSLKVSWKYFNDTFTRQSFMEFSVSTPNLTINKTREAFQYRTVLCADILQGPTKFSWLNRQWIIKMSYI